MGKKPTNLGIIIIYFISSSYWYSPRHHDQQITRAHSSWSWSPYLSSYSTSWAPTNTSILTHLSFSAIMNQQVKRKTLFLSTLTIFVWFLREDQFVRPNSWDDSSPRLLQGPRHRREGGDKQAEALCCLPTPPAWQGSQHVEPFSPARVRTHLHQLVILQVCHLFLRPRILRSTMAAWSWYLTGIGWGRDLHPGSLAMPRSCPSPSSGASERATAHSLPLAWRGRSGEMSRCPEVQMMFV